MYKLSEYLIDNKDGWELFIEKLIDNKKFDRSLSPALLIPGYGMNSFIFNYHPNGKSLAKYIADKGFEVWMVNFRQMGRSKCYDDMRYERYSLYDIAKYDLYSTVSFIKEVTSSKRRDIHFLSCSLGASIGFIYFAFFGEEDIRSFTNLGGPLRWIRIHPFIRTLFYSSTILKNIKIKRARELAKRLLPLIGKTPILSIYLHSEHIDMSKADEFVETVENPNRFINAEIAQWMKQKDLIYEGKNITHEFNKFSKPLLCLIANADGIVPPETVRFPLYIASSKIKDEMIIGNETIKFAHADLYISRYAQKMFFEPFSEWLTKVESSS
ncbi:MAG: alpha/beta fold hydrolase [Deltaproteobacteria bacterium]|nr:alpha/beta fold hydrolase [Deltaproteobacteria bacterium]